MKTRIFVFFLTAVLLLAAAAAFAEQESPANPALADWSTPGFTYSTAGSGNAERGYSLPTEYINKVMLVTPKSGGWTKLAAPVSGEYSFTVDTDQLQSGALDIDVYRAEGDIEELQLTDRLSFRRGEGIVTQVIHNILEGETIFWTEGAGAAAYPLMISSVNWSGEKQEEDTLPEMISAAPEEPAQITAADGLTGQPIITQTPRAGDTFKMGWYEQDGDPSRRERIEWTVLDVNEQQDTVLVISSLALDCVVYHPTRTAISWGDSYIRSWLKYDFTYSALSAAEQACIVPTNVAGVTDMVTMLDERQIKKYHLAETGCDVSYYARYCLDHCVNVKDEHGCWWVRMDTSHAKYKNQFVGRGGKVYGGSNRGGNYTTSSDNGVRPAMNLSISALKQCLLGDDFSVVVGTAVNASNPNVRLSNVTVRMNDETFVTNEQGKFFFTADIGAWHYSAQREGYIDAEGDIVTHIGKNVLTIPMCRMMAENEYRVLLTWGEYPRDLDSHLLGVSQTGHEYHVAYYALQADRGNALLEWDDTTSYGPETTHFIAYPGESYVFSVHDYTNRSSGRSNWMGNSGARVVVYRGNGEIADFTVPAESGTVWNVFRVDDNELTPIDTVGFCESPSNVGAGLR